MRRRNLIIFLIFAFVLSSANALAKDDKTEFVGSLGSPLLLIGTRSAETIDNVLRGVESLGKSVEHLSPDEKNFLFGYANYRLGKWNEADSFFKKCNNPLIEDHVLFFRGRSALSSGENEKAEELFTKLLSDRSGSAWAIDAKKYLAEAKINLGHEDDARKLIEQYLKSTSLASDAFDANLLLVRSYILQGDKDEAMAHLRRMATSVISENELTQLARLGGPPFERWMKDSSAQYDIATSLMEHSQWQDALNHLEKALSSGFEAKWLYARCHFRAHHYKEVIPLLEDLLKNNGEGGMRLTLQQHLASAYARVDDYKHSIELRRKIIRDYSRNPSVVLDSLSKIAFLLLDDGEYKNAIDEFEKVLRMKGGASLRTKVLWYIAWSHYKLKDYDSAVRSMNELLKGGRAKKSKIKIDDRVAYWKARSLENSGRRDEARALFREILSDHPIGYYGVLSKRRLEGDIRTSKDFADIEAYEWPKGQWKMNVPNVGDIASSSPHLARAIFFDRLNLHEEAAKELYAVFKEGVGATSVAPAQSISNLVMWLAGKNFVHDISYVLAHQRYAPLLRSLPHSDGFERFVWEQSYPEAYKPVVEKLVGQRFDPRLVYSIMRAESNFRPAVESPAGAVGLMQLMPVTAQKMSDELGDNEFDAHNLYRPSKNIEYGIQYLKKLYGLFPDNTVAVIASYNAGEEAVGRWLKHGYSPDIEEFIEEIPYDETNLYVKKVMMSYWILQQMYPN